MIPSVGVALCDDGFWWHFSLLHYNKIELKHWLLGVDIQAFTERISNMSEMCAGAITFLVVSSVHYYYMQHRLHCKDIERRFNADQYTQTREKTSQLREEYYNQHRIVVQSVDIAFKHCVSIRTLMTQYSVFRAQKYWPLDVKHIEYDEETMSQLETYRDKLATFYKKCADNDIYMSAGELYSCVTMHWLVYQTNGICKEKELDTKYIDTRYIHQKAMLSLELKDPEKARQAKNFQNHYAPMFSTIREAVWS